MFKKIVRVLTNPRRYVPLAIKMTQQPLCYLFRDASFFLQAQMDISRKSKWHNPAFVDLTGGFYLKNDSVERRIFDLDPWDATRRDMLVLFLRMIIDRKVEGDFAELGVYKGLTAKLIHHYAPDRRLYLFDTFEGFTERSVQSEREQTGLTVGGAHFADTSLEAVRKYIEPRNENVSFHKGYFPESIPPGFNNLKFAFIHLDADLYEPTHSGLEFFYPRLSTGGIVVIHDYNAWPGGARPLRTFLCIRRRSLFPCRTRAAQSSW